MAVDAGAGVLDIGRAAAGILSFTVTVELHPRVAQEEPIRVVPVIVDGRGRRIGSWTRLPGVGHETDAKDDDECHDDREEGSALKANLLTLALLRETSGLLGG